MALNAAHWEVTRATGNIKYTGPDHGVTASYATVIEFHRWLQSLADDAVAIGNDQLDITNTNPSQRSTDNIITLINSYNIDDASSEHLYDGSVIQNAGADIYDGIVNFGNAGVKIQIIQNGIVLTDDWWNQVSGGLNADATSGISHRFMIKVRSTTDIDGRRIIGTCRRFGYTYSEFTINATSRGNNVLALTDSADLNNATLEATVAGWSGAYTNTEGYANIDVNNDGTAEHYYSNWDINTGLHGSINDFYEYTKYVSRDGSAATLYGISGELFRGITHEISVSGGTGSFPAFVAVSWATGTGQMFAIDSATAPTKMWIQLLTGSAPGTSVVITATGGATATTSGSVIERTISKPFSGASTGSAIIGAYGLGIVASDMSSTDKVTNLANDPPISPPNYVTNTITGLVSGEDRILVAPGDGTTTDVNGDPAIIKTQLTLSTTLNTDNITEVVVTQAIPNYTPASGYIRVTDNNGFERRLHYSSINTVSKTFTISGGDYGDGNEDFLSVNATAPKSVYIAYIDQAASGTTATFTSVHSDDTLMNLVILVRDGGATPIKQYISRWTQGKTNQSTAPILTSDT